MQKGHTLLIQGPASFEVQVGKVNCLGASIPVGNELVVDRPRQYPLYALENSTIEIRLQAGGSCREVQGSTIPTGWSEASTILFQSPGVALIVGDVDSGKSSLCTFLANRCFNEGMRVAVIDGDVGQSDIGPPTTLSRSHLEGSILGLQDLRTEATFFLGDTSPSSVPEKLVDFLSRLVRDAAQSADMVLVNTDGWIGDRAALYYKSHLISSLAPRIVLALNIAGEIDPLLNLLTSTSLRLERSSYAQTRTKEERKMAREAGYKRFLNDARPRRLNLAQIKLRTFDQPKQTILRGNRTLRGVLVGLLNEAEELLSIGRIREMNGEQVLVETTAENSVRVVELGAIVLSSKYEEVGYSSLH